MRVLEQVTAARAAETSAPVRGIGLDASDHRLLSRIREFLSQTGYTEAGIQTALGAQGEISLRAAATPVHLRRLSGGGRLATAIRLFLLGVTVDRVEAALTLAPLDLDDLERIGLLERQNGGIRSAVKLAPYDGLLLVSDRPGDDRAPLPKDYVTGVNQTSVALANITARREAGSVLDLGTGGGVQALLASRHSARVVATDVNPRALTFTAFSAALNGIRNVEVRQGDLFRPVAGEKFDVIVCNPPYVISPDSTLTFRDGGMSGDAICRQIAQQVPAHLNEGGLAFMLCNWALRQGEPWAAPVKQWVSSGGCDAVVLHSRTEDPLTYAAKWNHPDLTASPRLGGDVLDRWLRYYRDTGTDAIASGAIIMRRSLRPNWVLALEGGLTRPVPAWEHILRLFEAQDFTAGMDDDQSLLAETFRLADHHRLDQTLECLDGKMSVNSCVLRLERGLDFRGNLDATSLMILSRCDGRLSLSEVLQELAVPGGPLSDEVTAAALSVVRRLYEFGFLERTTRLGNRHPIAREGRR